MRDLFAGKTMEVLMYMGAEVHGVSLLLNSGKRFMVLQRTNFSLRAGNLLNFHGRAQQ